ncbi:XdhC/CoxI family protein [Paraflavisolibacter sp. H34]|uniref:XdhC family protein n=1 Tax=Huijunlia imazamoxiresistens TaxID=3127457 RepID=UPI00301ADA57
MSKEIKDILGAFREAQRHGRQTALATVVHVEGSSYRRPGARMLVEDNGQITGAISGGCLEGDALRKALLAMHQRQNKLVTYNTLHEDDADFGVQLGCNGIVYILFEPIDPQQADNPLALLEHFGAQRTEAVVATLFSLENVKGPQRGTCYFFKDGATQSSLEDKVLEAALTEAAQEVLAGRSSLLQHYPHQGCSAFVELLQPPVSLVIVGAGNDALPLTEMATVLGWQVTVIDGRPSHANRQRFAKAHSIIVGKPAAALEQLTTDSRTAFVLMTHNYQYDKEMMKALLPASCSYIGTLGPKNRLQRLLSELQEEGFPLGPEQISLIHGPTGLDIGAETAEEIALSVLAEIKAVLAQRPGGPLRDRQDSIHARAERARTKTSLPLTA